MYLEDEEHVGYQIKILDRLFRREIENSMRGLQIEGMTCMNGWILGYLAHNGEKSIYQKDLESQFQVGRSSMSTTLKLMEEKGYIIRQPVPGDARLKRVLVTEKGRSFVHGVELNRHRMEEKITRGLTEEELKEFFRIVRKMCANLSE